MLEFVIALMAMSLNGDEMSIQQLDDPFPSYEECNEYLFGLVNAQTENPVDIQKTMMGHYIFKTYSKKAMADLTYRCVFVSVDPNALKSTN